MHILLTNDDGVDAPGLLAMAVALRNDYRLTVLAPDRNWSACGHVKTLTRPLRVRETNLSDGTPALTTDGAPSDCVALALLGLIDPDFGPAAQVGASLIKQIIANHLSKEIFFSINIPYLPVDKISGVAITRQGTRVYRDVLEKRLDPLGQPYYWIGGEAPTGVPDSGTDFWALARGQVSITPLSLEMTDHEKIATIEAWEFTT